ncbi:hypothetical protein DHEL01_v205174 [Diaporthe helianthi]|uniref:Uncharacterized protein n=1 Tax=Diaporthe helianthi TaxID=158607 RepID=A0A2P5I1S9_DIAHE|nr:hypothetical protein DHEL01_v205174 [Diaporthe helianthi]
MWGRIARNGAQSASAGQPEELGPAGVCAVCVSAQGPGVELLQGRDGELNGAAAGVSFSVGAFRDPPAGRIITGHRGQGPDLASARVVWLSQSRLHPPEREWGKPTQYSVLTQGAACEPCLPRVQSRLSLPSNLPPPAVQPVQPVQGLPACQPASQPACSGFSVESTSSWPGQGVPGLPPGRQRPSALVGPTWSTTSSSDPQPDRGQILATHT